MSCRVQCKTVSHVVLLLAHADQVGGCGCAGHRGIAEAVEE